MRLSKKSRYLLEQLQKALAVAKRAGAKEEAKTIEDEINQFLDPKRGKILDRKKKPKQPKVLKFKKGTDPRIMAARENGRKGGLKTASLYPKETRQKWGTKAGNSTLTKYGKQYYKHIRSLRKPKQNKTTT